MFLSILNDGPPQSISCSVHVILMHSILGEYIIKINAEDLYYEFFDNLASLQNVMQFGQKSRSIITSTSFSPFALQDSR